MNNVSLTTTQGQECSGGNPQMIHIQGGTVGSTHNVIFWVDDVYTHQYAANVPAVTAGSEQGNTATSYTFTAPSPASGYVNSASGNFTVTPNGAFTGTITITPSGGGLSTPIVLTFSNSAIAQTFTVTPTAVGTANLTPTNSGALTNPANLSYAVSSPPATAFTFTAPSPASGCIYTASGGFTVTPNNPYSGTITITPGGCGLASPIVLSFSNSAAPQTFTITPTSLGTVTLTATNSGGLTNPPAMSYTVTVAPTLWTYLSTTRAFPSGLAGAVGYTIYKSDGTIYAARTTVDVAAVGAECYAASVRLPYTGPYVIQWDDAQGHYDYDPVPERWVEPPSAAYPAGVTERQSLSLILAAVSGQSSGGSNPVFLAPDGMTARITGAVDSSGNRTLSTLSPPS
jgi:hypothetical protein